MEGVAYYNRIIDELLRNGITQYATLFHWNTATALEMEMDGFMNSESQDIFAALSISPKFKTGSLSTSPTPTHYWAMDWACSHLRGATTMSRTLFLITCFFLMLKQFIDTA